MDRNVYLVVYKTEGFEDISVFSSRSKANYNFEKKLSKFNLTESEEWKCWYVREAYGKGKANTKTGDASLCIIKKMLNFDSL